MELKRKFKYRLILDESQSIGVLGSRGAGLTDLFNIDVSLIDKKRRKRMANAKLFLKAQAG